MISEARKRTIGLDQRVPFSVIDSGIVCLLETGKVDSAELLALIMVDRKGENRAKKAAGYAFRILSDNNPVLLQLKKYFTVETYSKMSERDRFLLCACLVCIRYPFMYDTICLLGTQFKIQTTVSRAFINQKMSLKYGSNRTFDVGMDALIPMIIEAGLLVRLKNGIYGRNDSVVRANQFVKEAWIKTDCLISGIKQISVEELTFRPWMSYVDISDIKWDSCVLLKILTESGQKIWVE